MHVAAATATPADAKAIKNRVRTIETRRWFAGMVYFLLILSGGLQLHDHALRGRLVDDFFRLILEELVEGFFHAMSRGQYAQTNPTDSVGRFFDQTLSVFVEGAMEEYTMLFLCLGLIPFLFYGRMKQRERGWLAGEVSCSTLSPFLPSAT